MTLIESLLQALRGLGLGLLVERLHHDFHQPSYWHSYSEPRQILCSFLNVYLDHSDADARLTLCPTNEANALVEEIITDVIPVIRRKLGV